MTSVITTSRLDLVCLPVPVLRRVEAGDVAELRRLLGVDVPPAWPPIVPARLLLAQLRVDPGQQPWLNRALVLRDEQRVVGTAGFHGAPDERGRVEIGYAVLPEYRRRGLAREAVLGLTGWAASTGQARTCVASVAPDNAASLALVASLGFTRVGEQVDPEDGLEWVFDRPLPLPAG